MLRYASCLFLATLIGCSDSTSDGPSDAGVRDADAATAHPLCVDGQSVDGIYPKRTYGLQVFDTIPDLTFDSVDETNQPSQIHLHDYFEPCAAQSRLLVVRVGAEWCGTCRWHTTHTKDLVDLDIGSRLEFLDLLVANDDNDPATVGDIAAYKSRIDAPQKVAIDPEIQFAPALVPPLPLPFIALVDTRTMKIFGIFGNPDPDLLAYRIKDALATLDKTQASPTPSTDGVDGFHRNEWDLLKDMTLPAAPPPDPTNAKADDPAAAALGNQLFSDKSLSPTGTVACSTCHDPTKSFADGLPQAVGVATGDRNSPSVLLAAHARWQFWDGRADSLWAQALGPFENPKEFDSSRLFVAHATYDRYKAAYEGVFGALPPLSDTSRFPASGKPGEPAWAGMTTDDQKAVTRVYVNVGKSIAAFERTLRVKPNALDQYIAGDVNALSEQQKTGLHMFFLGGCIQCHYGPRLTDDAFHSVRFPTGRQDGKADNGRTDGIPMLLASEFLANGPFSDDSSAAHGLVGLAPNKSTLGAFKTTTLRGITSTAPYGHGGTLATLTDVAKNYGNAGLDGGDPRAVGVSEPWLPQFLEVHALELVPFLEVLTAEQAP